MIQESAYQIVLHGNSQSSSLTSTVDKVAQDDEMEVADNVSNATTKTNRGDIFDRPKLVFPTPLPDWGSQINDIIENNQLLLKTRVFVNAAAHFLRTQTNDAPLKSEYAAFARTLCREYPELKKLSSQHDNEHVCINVVFFATKY